MSTVHPSSFDFQWLIAMESVRGNGDDAKRFFYEVVFVGSDGTTRKIAVRATSCAHPREYLTANRQWIDLFIRDLRAGWFDDVPPPVNVVALQGF